MSSGTALLIFTQIASRGLTFIGNQIVLRYSSPTLLGIAVQLELVSVTVLYFARESLRVALLRQPRTGGVGGDQNGDVVNGDGAKAGKGGSDESRRLQGAINMSYLAILLGLMLGACSFTYYGYAAAVEVTASPGFRTAYQCYILATLFELLAEPAFVVIQQKGLFRARASVETRAAIARCVTACCVAVYINRTGQPSSTLPFATGQLAYGLTLFVLYHLAAREAVKGMAVSLLPARLAAPNTQNVSDTLLSIIPLPLLTLSLTFYAQSTFKLLLTQGDALLLSVIAPLASQGAFALASNYSGLLARLIFQPIEESSRNTFGQLLNATGSVSTPANQGNNRSLHSSASPANTRKALTHLSTTLHTYMLASLPLLTLAPPLLPLLTPILLSSAFRTPSTVVLLQTYIYTLPLMATNGVLDAFVSSVATPKQLHYQSLTMLLFTLVYGVSCWILLRIYNAGPAGLVWAGGIAMAGRCAAGAAWVWGWVAERKEESRRGEGANGLTQMGKGKRVAASEKASTKSETRGSTVMEDEQGKVPTSAEVVRMSLPRPASLLVSAMSFVALQVLLPASGSAATPSLRSSVAQRTLGVIVAIALVQLSSLVIIEREFLLQILDAAMKLLPRGVRGRVEGIFGTEKALKDA